MPLLFSKLPAVHAAPEALGVKAQADRSDQSAYSKEAPAEVLLKQLSL